MAFIKLFVVPTLLLAVAATGCANAQEAATADPTGAATSAVEAASQGTSGHPFLGRVKSALASVNLTDAQKTTLQTVETTLQAQTAPVRSARQAFGSALSGQVAKGAIDPNALATPLANLAQAADNAKPAFQTAANALYTTLTAPQREQFVAAMKQQAEAFHGGGHDHGPHARLKKLAAELNLTTDQIASIRTAVKAQWAGHAKGEFGAAKERMQTLAQAFTSSSFDAAALDVGSGLSKMASDGPNHLVKMIGIILPILTPGQQQQLAQIIQTKASSLADE